MKKELIGIFGVWKPRGPSSYDVIREIKKHTTEKRIGHAGTLDPRASGVLVIAVGRDATKKIADEVAKEKEYIASIHLGTESTTDDSEGMKTAIHPIKKPALILIKKSLKDFEGEIMQIPPVYSAIKVQGSTAYKRTRAGEVLILPARKVLIKKIEFLSFSWPYLKIKVTTGPGVYIRSLARDIGRKLNVGGYLSSLERTRVGNFSKEDALILDISYNTPKKS
ncbi:MAG: tRNA pseudouridine(55) synthase TruB [Candidatus Jorgensenbacteria bacterium]|nr:tRNA pseudouridine(55) synthase TruB [Candidatus Jorgensenbacteria bacterium]